MARGDREDFVVDIAEEGCEGNVSLCDLKNASIPKSEMS